MTQLQAITDQEVNKLKYEFQILTLVIVVAMRQTH